MSVLTEEQTKAILDGAIEEIKQAVIKEAKDSVAWNMKHEIETSVSKIVREFILAEVKPEILVSLTTNKSVIIDAAILGAEEMAKELAKAMAESLAENLANSYTRKKILEEMFG